VVSLIGMTATGLHLVSLTAIHRSDPRVPVM
jgi:hypothetical protein